MKQKDKIVDVITEDGTKIQGEILFTFEANGDDFVLYEVEDKTFAAKFKEKETNQLEPVLDDEWPLVEKIYNEFISENEFVTDMDVETESEMIDV